MTKGTDDGGSSFIQQLLALAEVRGVVAVAVHDQNDVQTAGESDRVPLLNVGLDLLQQLDDRSPRLTLPSEDLCLRLWRKGPRRVAVLLPVGHPLAKSLNRYVGRVIARAGGT
ncbi:hypothetical protein [Nannocystis sp. SCPEA4]|uniref:hypothetical protein n=1 Tax=Nannocystis sp. SCPEA4 TaxID=2996787 RepID=UPI0022701EFE|nr:hypothetical protein [Nannocystis sp. SCPEA4]MCY1062162.1 hypothetical protein [Nannocystis sp. SCPEA4]